MRACPTCGEENPDRARFCSECATPLEPRGEHAERKVVTALFCDLVGSTALGEEHDPEVLQPLLGGYFGEARTAIERHGGRVEKFIGDAVAAVFGVPLAHEDDALRAVRAAADIQAAVRRRNGSSIVLSCRVGVTTGEVLVPGNGAAVIGDAMNTAARLQAGAAPDSIVLGEPTFHLVRDAVRAEPLEAIHAHGKSEPVRAYRLIQVLAGAPGVARHLDSPVVGRERERRMLADALQRAAEDSGVQLVTIVGHAGIGKTRLVEEFMATSAGKAVIVRGRCLAYGDGITFWPIAEIIRDAAGILDGDPLAIARGKVEALLPDGPERAAIVERVTELLGLGATPNPDETFWAVRKVLEGLAVERPLVAVIEDLHWAEPRLLDLIEHVTDWSRGSPIVLLCDARPELLELRAGWAGGKLNASTVLLQPLSTTEVQELIVNLLGRSELDPAVIARVVEAAEGNPLFVEQLLAMLADQGVLRFEDGRWATVGKVALVVVPPTIQALLGARLDGLRSIERRLLEAGAVEGRTFHVGTAAALCDLPRTEAAELLVGLVRRELLRPDRPSIEGEDAFRFRHILITDAAYRAIPKRIRAELHERFADHLEARLGDRAIEYQEILGHHLERATELHAELATGGGGGLAERAASHLAAAGRRALARGDSSAAVTLIGRAVALVPESPDRLDWVPDLAWAMQETGQVEDARHLLDETVASSSEDVDGVRWHRIRVEQVLADIEYGGRRSQADALGVVDATADAARAAGDHLTLARALTCRGRIFERLPPSDLAEAAVALAGATEAAIRSGDVRAIADAENLAGGIYCWGPYDIDEGVAFCERSHALTVLTDRLLWGYALANAYARRHAFRGEFDEARAAFAKAIGEFEDLGSTSGWYAALITQAEMELLAGDWAAAAAAVDVLTGRAELTWATEPQAMSPFAPWIAHIAAAVDDVVAAKRWLARVPPQELDDGDSRPTVAAARVRLLLLSGDTDAALTEARRGVTEERDNEWLDARSRLLEAAAVAFESAARRDELRSVLGDLAEIYHRKGNLVGLGQAERRLAVLDAGWAPRRRMSGDRARADPRRS